VQLDKLEVLARLRQTVASDLARAAAAQRQTQRAATHEESKPENDKDTRALESSYLARGLAERVAALENAVVALAAWKPRDFHSDTPVALFALVTLEAVQSRARNHYFVVPAAGGVTLLVGGETVLTVTPEAPLGRALIGAFEGDEVSVQTPHGPRAVEIARVF
jgi:transcription elongation GreA/GreB family factor